MGETRGRKFFNHLFSLHFSIYFVTWSPNLSRLYPNITLGNQYPHPFPNDDYKGVKLNFPKDCPADDSRYEFPLMNGSPYDGGKNNVKQGDERVVFYYEDGEISYDGNPQVYYCGIMTHKGAATGGLLMC